VSKRPPDAEDAPASPPTIEAPALVVEPAKPKTREERSEASRTARGVRRSRVAGESETALRTEGQRATSLVYEHTQMRLAMIAVAGFMAAHIFIVIAISWVLVQGWESLVEAPGVLAVLAAILTSSLGAMAAMAAMVAATYFQRTNSHKIGGVGKDYEGR
jgi:hypothetical protein